MNKKEYILDLMIKEYEERNTLIKAEAGKRKLVKNTSGINNLIDRYINECVGKVSKG